MVLSFDMDESTELLTALYSHHMREVAAKNALNAKRTEELIERVKEARSNYIKRRK